MDGGAPDGGTPGAVTTSIQGMARQDRRRSSAFLGKRPLRFGSWLQPDAKPLIKPIWGLTLNPSGHLTAQARSSCPPSPGGAVLPGRRFWELQSASFYTSLCCYRPVDTPQWPVSGGQRALVPESHRTVTIRESAWPATAPRTQGAEGGASQSVFLSKSFSLKQPSGLAHM